MFQVTKSFLSSIGIRDDSSAASLFFYHFIDGVRYTSVVTQQNGSDYDAIKLAEIKANLKKVFNWTDSIPITRLAAHNCSDLLIYTGFENGSTFRERNLFSFLKSVIVTLQNGALLKLTVFTTPSRALPIMGPAASWCHTWASSTPKQNCLTLRITLLTIFTKSPLGLTTACPEDSS